MTSDDLLLQLVAALDDELEQLTLLRFRLVVLGSLVGCDQTTWLQRSVRELETAAEQLRLTELQRAAATTGVTEACTLDPESRLEDIADRVEPNWGEVLHERRRQLLEELADLQHLTATATSALGRRSALVADALAFLRDGTGNATYGRKPASRAQLVRGAL